MESAIPNDSIPVLDHGYVLHVESWGRGLEARIGEYEAGIVEAARQSTQGSFRGWGGAEQCKYCGADGKAAIVRCAATDTGEHTFGPYGPPGDEKLINRLMAFRHTTPFEFAGMTIEVQLPIVVTREWHRHRTQSYNEASGRYTQLPDLYYAPDKQNVMDRAAIAYGHANKQAASVAEPDETQILNWLDEGAQLDRVLEAYYQTGLRIGVPKELARLRMPVNHYTKMRASTDLWNWLHFLGLRTAPDAQWEIRQYAKAVQRIISEQFPRTFAAWEHGADEASR